MKKYLSKSALRDARSDLQDLFDDARAALGAVEAEAHEPTLDAYQELADLLTDLMGVERIDVRAVPVLRAIKTRSK